MVRTYVKKTKRGDVKPETFERAYTDMKLLKISLRAVAAMHGIDRTTLARYVKKKDGKGPQVLMGYAKHRQILCDNIELQLKEYILHCSKIYYGLTPKNVRGLAYELAVANNVKVPDTWATPKLATAEWFTAYMKRHPSLSIRSPESTSLSRATSFNKHNVGLFFTNLKNVLDRYKFSRNEIWNTDETGVQTVQRLSKIVAGRGERQVGKATSAERGSTVTMVIAANAIGNSVPPMFIFPRVFFKEHFINGGPPGCIGTAHPSGWMTGPSFLLFMKHFHCHAKSTKEHPCLLILDNHDSHLSVAVLNFCKDHGIILLSFPPHTSHRLQPLDKSVFGPFKKFYSAAVDNWMTSNPGKPVTIYDIPGIVNCSLPNATTPKNITSGFQATGIMPFNSAIFTDADFLSSAVTDRPLQVDYIPGSTSDSRLQNIELSETIHEEFEPVPSTINAGQEIPRSPVSPEELRPYPKAGERKRNRKGKQPMKSSILTDTPVKARLEDIARERAAKKEIKERRAKEKLYRSLEKAKQSVENSDRNSTSNTKADKKNKNKQIAKGKKMKADEIESESEDEDCLCLMCLKPYSASKPGQKWIQCISCKKWAHVQCGNDSVAYMCIHCESDGSLFSDED